VEHGEAFRNEVRAWLEANLPESLKGRGWPSGPDLALWRQRMGDRGFACPSWPKEYGGGGLSAAEIRILQDEMRRLRAPASVAGFGVSMLGPVLLEFGNDAQKREHLPGVIYGRVSWCQGYSEPGAGSDLASLQTRAVRDGDEYVINGQKIWTSGAQNADWIFCLVRTDPDAPKHDGISFVLFDLRSPGVEIQPIPLISGASSFCQVFFQDVRVPARNLIGRENGGWTIAKRLLQHERTMLSGGMGGGTGAPARAVTGDLAAFRSAGSLGDIAKRYVGARDERIADAILRDQVAQVELDALCYRLTNRRSAESAKAGQGPGHTASMFKLYASEMNKRRQELTISILGSQGLGWEGNAFDPFERASTRQWLRSKGNSIEGGTSEVQLNVIAKRVLGLPD